MTDLSKMEQPGLPPMPVRERDEEALASALTFFLTRSQRSRVLRALRRVHPQRARALLITLGLEDTGVGS